MGPNESKGTEGSTKDEKCNIFVDKNEKERG